MLCGFVYFIDVYDRALSKKRNITGKYGGEKIVLIRNVRVTRENINNTMKGIIHNFFKLILNVHFYLKN